MGLFDTVMVPCPKCGEEYPAQSKGSPEPYMRVYKFADAPSDVLSDVNRHAPWRCEKCRTVFIASVIIPPVVVRTVVALPEGTKAQYEK